MSRRNMAAQTQTPNAERTRPVSHHPVQKQGLESWQPQLMNKTALARAQEMARAVTDSLGGRGLFGVELFIRGEEVFFSEVSPRPHDTGMVTMASQGQNEFELHARAVLGLPVSTEMRTPAASAVIYGGMEEQGIAFEDIENALAIPQSDLRLFGKPESFIRRRMGVALAYDDNVEVARVNAKKVAARVIPVKE